MSNKLYSAVDPVVSVPPPLVNQPLVSVESLFTELDRHVKAYDSVQTVYNEIASESLTFVDNKNVVLFNEYMRVLQTNLGVSPKAVHHVALEQMPIATVNYEISLEGWLKSIWEKIKGFFKKIFDAVGEFMKRHFTRLGRIKMKLENIQKVAKESSKTMGLTFLDDLPSGLKSKFKGFGDISESTVTKGIAAAKDSVEEIKNIVALTNKAANSELLDANFVSEIKKLKETALAAQSKIANNKEARKDLTLLKGKDREEIGKMKKENKSLAQVAADATDESEFKDHIVKEVGADLHDTDDNMTQAAQETYKSYMEDVKKSLEKHVGVKVIGAKMIEKVEINGEGQLEVTLDEKDGDEPKGANLTNAEGVQTLAAAALEMIKAAEDMASGYAKVNDAIMKRVGTVDSLIADIDRVDPERYGKYRAVLDKRIRTRLKMMQNLFRSYNQVNKNFFEVALSTGDAVVDYCVTSMKHFR